MKSKIIPIVLAGVVLLGACKSKTYESDGSNNVAADSAKVATDTVTAKLVKTADVHFKVKNVQQTSENISAQVNHYGGMVVHRHISSTTNQCNDFTLNNDSVMRVSSVTMNAEMTVKLPVEKVDSFLNVVGHNSLYVSEQRMDIEDKSLDYLSAKLKLQNRQELVARQKTGKVIIKDPTAVMNLKDDLVDQQIGNKRIDDETRYSTITLGFYQSNTISKEIVVNDDPSVYNTPFASRLVQALNNGWNVVCEILIGVANLWAIILLGIGLWIGVRILMKKKVLVIKAH